MRNWNKLFSGILLVSVITFISSPALTDDFDRYKYCEYWGIAGGNEDYFMQNILDRLMVKHEISILDATCQSLKTEAYQFSKEYSKGGSVDTSALQRWQRYQIFRDEFLDKLIESVEY